MRHREVVSSIRTILLILAPIALLLGCTDPPGPPGSDVVGDGFESRRIVIDPASIDVESGIAAVANASSRGTDVMLAGRSTDMTTADALLALVDTSARFIDIDPGEVQSARIRLFPVGYRFGDTNASTSFDVVSIDGVFDESTQFDGEIDVRISAGRLLGSFNGQVLDSTTIYIDLDVGEVTTFLREYAEIVVVDGRTEINTLRSIALRGGESEGAIASFLGATVRDVDESFLPALEVTLADTTIVMNFGVSSWIVEQPSSVGFGPDLYTLASGSPIRTHLRFSLDSIPENALIQRAALTLSIDPASEQFGTSGPITELIGIVAGADTRSGEDAFDTRSASGLLFVIGNRPARDDESLEDQIRFLNLSGVISRWLRFRSSNGADGLENFGLILSIPRANPAIEGVSLDRFRFFGSDAVDPVLRPVLDITYAVPTGIDE